MREPNRWDKRVQNPTSFYFKHSAAESEESIGVIRRFCMKPTLYSLFISSKDELTSQLEGLTLPSGAQEVQSCVVKYFNKIFDADGDFRQNLTQSEDYILQAAISMLTMQQSMMGTLIPTYDNRSMLSDDASKSTRLDSSKAVTGQLLPLGGSALGGTTGALLFGTWGAVFGAIAGTAVSMYFSSRMSLNTTVTNEEYPSDPAESELNVDAQAIPSALTRTTVASL